VRWQQSGWSMSRFAFRQRATILSGIILNENFKLLQISYLAQKWMFCLIFLLGHIVLVAELMARLCSSKIHQRVLTSTKCNILHSALSNSPPFTLLI
jgi:hypothetical protein